MSIEEVEALLRTSARDGLTADEAGRRLHHHGRNVLPPPERVGPLARLVAQVANPLIYVLLAAVVITLAMGEWVDSAVIAGVVVVNVVVGFAQESRAEGALRALMSMSHTAAVVSRGGRRTTMEAADLVPGDLVHLGEGDRVPADIRIASASHLRVDESMLTGESLPSAKDPAIVSGGVPLADRDNMAYAGTLVVSGTADGLVMGTGADTEIGRIQRLVGEAADLATPLTQRINRFSVILTVAIVVLALATFALGLVRGEPATEMFTAAIALAVAAIPEGLPAAVTITLAIGVSRMARRKAIVRHLPAAEALGSTTVICSDKTGTLTLNRMTVTEMGLAPDRQSCLRAGVLCSDATEDSGDPTEVAIIVAAGDEGIDVRELRSGAYRVASIPFASERAWMATLDCVGDAPPAVHVKGAVGRVLERTSRMMTPEGRVALDRDAVLHAARTMAAHGLRVLAVATGAAPAGDSLSEDDVQELTLLGLVGMLDPPRPEAVDAVAECRAAGVRVIMVTGDQLETARAIGQRLSIAGDRDAVAISGADLDIADPGALMRRVEGVDVIARVSPEQKLRLVEALQADGEVVAMTGDGVNDAPALRQADIGVAMGRGGTEVAKEASDVVLADDNFATITAAVREGRRVFDNITKFIVWTLPVNIAQGLLVLVAVLLGIALPVLPTQILWINMTSAIMLGLPLAVERLEPGTMARPPRDPSAPLVSGLLLRRMVLVGVLLVAATFGLYEWVASTGASEAAARTVAVNTVLIGEAFYLLNCRSLTGSFLRMGAFSNRWILAGVGGMVLLQLAFTYAPPMQAVFGTAAVPAWTWAAAIVAGVVIAVVVGAEKALIARRGRSGPNS
jgi:cation-transporting P-type ATPase F